MSDIFRDYSFGGQLREARIGRGESLRSFATRIGTDSGNYSKLEGGRLSPPPTFKKCKEMLVKLEIPEDKHRWMIGQAYEHHLGRLREKWKGEL